MRCAGRAGVAVTGLALLAALVSAPPSDGSPSVPAGAPLLFDVSVVSSTDAWAVGFNNGSLITTSIWHWDGQTWSEVESPNPGTQVSELFGVDAVSATDVWAVGRYTDDDTLANTLVEHWDGSQWSVVPSPNSAQQGSQDALFEVSAASANDVWAAGYAGFGGVYQLLEHWNGKRWRVVSAARSSDYFDGVSAWSSTDAWAVGYHGLEHWDGSTWSVPTGPVGDTALRDIAGSSSSDLWAVGIADSGKTFTAHWDGAAWTVVPSPNGKGGPHRLNGVTAISPSDVWAVGYWQSHHRYGPLIEHWNGTEWSRTRLPHDEFGGTSFTSVDGSSRRDVWAVGYPIGSGYRMAHWDGKHWHPYALP